MTILIGALEFAGPYCSLDEVANEPGIYTILCQERGDYELVEMGDADFIKEYIFDHPDRQLWHENGMDIQFAVHYTADLAAHERREIKEMLEVEFDLELDAAA